MKHLLAGIVLVILASPSPAQAQLFGKKARINPSQRVPELILIVKTDGDERRRAMAAEELRDYDVTAFTEIVPVLADVLKNDKKVNVRLEALLSLTRIRPVSVLAGQAIEKAAADDESWRVRFQAKSALPKYHLAGYTPPKGQPAPGPKQTTQEPPVKAPPAPGPKQTTQEPPAKTPPAPGTSSGAPRPLPPVIVQPAPKTPPPAQQGPALFP